MSIQSNGASRDVRDGWYTGFVFGTYMFALIDSRGNNIYYAYIEDSFEEVFICKSIDNNWLVRIVHL